MENKIFRVWNLETDMEELNTYIDNNGHIVKIIINDNGFPVLEHLDSDKYILEQGTPFKLNGQVLYENDVLSCKNDKWNNIVVTLYEGMWTDQWQCEYLEQTLKEDDFKVIGHYNKENTYLN